MASVEGAAAGKEGEVVEVPGSQDIQPATQAEVDAGIARASKGDGVPTTSLRDYLPLELIGEFREGGIADVLVPGANGTWHPNSRCAKCGSSSSNHPLGNEWPPRYSQAVVINRTSCGS